MIVESKFKSAWWLPGPHLQTVWPELTRRKVDLAPRRERIELPDGDFIELDWVGPDSGPTILVMHGLGGSIESHYATPLLNAINSAGWRAAFMHFRGASGTPNRLIRFYHAGDTGDINLVANILSDREPETPLCAIGVSLGGNVLLKWLGETGEHNPLLAAVAISVPFELYNAAHSIGKGFSRVYQWWMLKELVAFVEQKFNSRNIPLEKLNIRDAKSFWEFDDKLTAPIHGFRSAKDYYINASSRPYLKDIAVPTLVIHSKDDPFMTPDVIPEKNELSSTVRIELSKHGGHVGFIGGKNPLKPEYWLETRIPEFFNQFI